MGIKDEKQLRKAIAEIEKRATTDGWSEAISCLKLAHVHATHNSIDAAVKHYLRAADLYAETGFDLKVMDVLKQLLKLAPDHAAAQERLSRLLASTENTARPVDHSAPLPAAPPEGAPRTRRPSRTDHATLPPRTASKANLPAVTPRSTSKGDLPAVTPRSTSKANLAVVPARSTSKTDLPASKPPPVPLPDDTTQETTLPNTPAPPPARATTTKPAVPAAPSNAWDMVTDKVRNRIAAAPGPVSPPPPPNKPVETAASTPVPDVSGKVRAVGAPRRALLLVDGRDQSGHARRLDLDGTWQVAMACEPVTGEGESCALVMIKGGRVHLGLADGARDRPGGAVAADAVCLEIRRLRSAGEPAEVLHTIDQVLKVDSKGGQSSGMLAAITAEQVTGATVGGIAMFTLQGKTLSAVTGVRAQGPLLGSGAVVPSAFETGWSGTLLAATAGVTRYVDAKAMGQCLSLPDVGNAAQALLRAARAPNGSLREDALVVVLRHAGS
jgi:hypothetical protein